MTIDTSNLRRHDFRIATETPGIELFVRNRRRGDVQTFSAEKTVVMVHGATYSSGSLYDVPLGGFSFIDYLAAGGYDVYALDVRGYGHSSRPKTMEEPPENGAPTIDTDTGVRDLSIVVDAVLRHGDLDRLNIFAMSWGGTVASAFTSRNNARVNKLALLAPQWLTNRPVPIDPGGPLGAYRLVAVHEARARWLGAAPPHGRTPLIPDGWFEQWAASTLDEDPWSRDKTPGRLRATNGPIGDIRRYWAAGRKYYDPAEVTVPVLLVHGEWDADVPIEVALDYFQQFRNARYRKWTEIGEATHLVLLEKNRLLAFKAVRDFFDEAFEPER